MPIEALPDNDLRLVALETLAREGKVYADEAKTDADHDGDADKNKDSSNAGPDINSFFFTDMTALQYKEYTVIKINRHGTRQKRTMGIDGDRIYNIIGRGVGSFMAKKGTKKPFKFIRDVDSVVRVENAPRPAFSIVYNENGEATKYLYEVSEKDPAECAKTVAEIVAKIRYLVRMHKDAIGATP